MDDDDAHLHLRENRQARLVLSRRGWVAAVAVAAFGVGAGNAAASTPSGLLAKYLKRSMQASYNKTTPGLRITTVTCVIAPGGASAQCQAHFTIYKERANGVFQVHAKINTKTGGVTTHTTSVKCTDSTSGEPLRC